MMQMAVSPFTVINLSQRINKLIRIQLNICNFMAVQPKAVERFTLLLAQGHSQRITEEGGEDWPTW